MEVDFCTWPTFANSNERSCILTSIMYDPLALVETYMNFEVLFLNQFQTFCMIRYIKCDGIVIIHFYIHTIELNGCIFAQYNQSFVFKYLPLFLRG